MGKDPLSVFLNEKVAAELAPNTPLQALEQRPFTRDPDPQSLDPGERAMAGMLAVGGSAVGGAVTFLSQLALRSVALGDAAPVSKHMTIGPIGKMEELGLSKRPRAKVMGLFDIKSRQPKLPRIAELDLENMMRTGESATHPVSKRIARQSHAFQKITTSVDSFIDKYNLKKKGVTLNFQQGPLSWLAGPRYELAKKRVYLPDISKSLALHELGHAADYTAGRLGKIRGVLEPMLRRGAMIALPAALIAGDQIKELLPGTIDDKAIEFMQNHAPEIMGATLAATSLYPEAKASVLALQHIAKTEGQPAVLKAMKRLGAGWGTYVLGAIPAIVGMSLARKYMREARLEKAETEDIVQHKLRELEKTGGLLRELNPLRIAPTAARWARSSARDIAHVGSQIGRQSKEMFDNREVLKRLSTAAKEVGTDPVFAQGALISAVPAAMAALYLYGSHSGQEIRSRMDPADINRVYSGSDKGIGLVTKKTDDSWREENPLKFAGLVAAGAALSGGIMAKLFSDLARIL